MPLSGTRYTLKIGTFYVSYLALRRHMKNLLCVVCGRPRRTLLLSHCDEVSWVCLCICHSIRGTAQSITLKRRDQVDKSVVKLVRQYVYSVHVLTYVLQLKTTVVEYSWRMYCNSSVRFHLKGSHWEQRTVKWSMSFWLCDTCGIQKYCDPVTD
jgi:hypothetical protein